MRALLLMCAVVVPLPCVYSTIDVDVRDDDLVMSCTVHVTVQGRWMDRKRIGVCLCVCVRERELTSNCDEDEICEHTHTHTAPYGIEWCSSKHRFLHELERKHVKLHIMHVPHTC